MHRILAKKILLKPKLDKHYPDFAPRKLTIGKCFAKFKQGEISTEDDARIEPLKRGENIKIVHKIILDDRNVKLIEIAEAPKISKKRVEHILYECLGMRKLCSKRVRREFNRLKITSG